MQHNNGAEPRGIDFDSLRSANPIADVAARYLELRRAGSEYAARCPFHADKTPSFCVVPKKDKAFCMGCGWAGDVVDFVAGMEGCDLAEAARRLGHDELPRERPTLPALPADDGEEWEPVLPVPDHVPGLTGFTRWVTWNPKRANWWAFDPVAHWAYYSANSELLGYVARIEYADRKITPTITYCRHRETGEHRWCSRPFPTPRPLYGLDQLAARPNAPVLYVSGEKCAEAGRRQFPQSVVVTNPGGDRGIASTDLSPLYGRNVTAWPDLDRQKGADEALLPYADQSGPKACVALLARLAPFRGPSTVLRLVDLNEEFKKDTLPDGWDIADAERDGWDAATVRNFGKMRLVVWNPPAETPDPAPSAREGGHHDTGRGNSGPGAEVKYTETPVTVDEGEREREEVMQADDDHDRADAGRLAEASRGDSAETGGAHPSARAMNGAFVGLERHDSLPAAEDESEDGDAMPALYSEDNVALSFAALHADNLRYVAAWGRWMQWNGQHWQHDDTLAAYDLSRKVCRSVVAHVRADPNIKPSQQDAVANKYGQAQTVAAVERLARSDRRLGATTEQWDADLWSLNTPGGIVDLRTGLLRDPGRGDYATKITRATPRGDCPNWLRFLSKSTAGDADLQAFLARVAGYALTGSTRDQALFFVYGSGGNGKGTFLNTLTWILNDYAAVAGIDTFTESRSDRHTTELARLRGARMVSAQEVEEGKRWAEAKIKAITGGDPITARFMRMDDFTFTPQFKLIIAGNHKPLLRNVDEAIKRRMHLIPFTVNIPAAERDPHLAEKLRNEADGILAWCVRGCLDWQRIGLQPPGSVLAATDEYLEQQDTMAAWLDECCDVGAAYSARSSKLYASFRRWAEGAGEYVLPQKRWSAAMEARGYLPKRRKQGVEFDGLRVTYDGADERWADL